MSLTDLVIHGQPIDITHQKQFTVQVSATPQQIAFLHAPQPEKTYGDCQLCNQWSMILAIQLGKNVCPACWKMGLL